MKVTMKVTVIAFVFAAVLHACSALKGGSMNEASSPLPKIVHQLAPANKKFWPDVWFMCQERWKSLYGDWKYMLWNDEDVDNLVKAKYPKEYGWFKSAPMKILRVDAARAFILDAYGGIYADMDFYPYKRLELPENGKALLVGSGAENEVVQNSFMASTQGHKFWKLCFQMMSSYITAHPTKPAREDERQYVLNATGPWMLGRALQAGGDAMMEPLDRHKYNPDPDEAKRCTETNICFMRHMQTGCWGVNDVKCIGWSRDVSKERKLNAALHTTKKAAALLSKETKLTEAVEDSEEEAPAEARIVQQIVGQQLSFLSLWDRYLEGADSSDT